MKTSWRNFLALTGSLVLESPAFSIDENEAFAARAALTGMPIVHYLYYRMICANNVLTLLFLNFCAFRITVAMRVDVGFRFKIRV